jgi:fumarylacetoacetate (FAA) hydrolase family protein
MPVPADAFSMLPADWRSGVFVGRIATSAGPSPVLLRDGIPYDVSGASPTVSALLDRADIASVDGRPLGSLDETELFTTGGLAGASLLAPIDLQCIKAAGVTFAASAIERVIEEQALGDAAAASALRGRLEAKIGAEMRSVKPGTPSAQVLKAALLEEGAWSQYLEVAIGPDAEIFTKAPVLAAVGWGADVGIRSDSSWNNSEPEIVLVANSAGQAVGATLGNDLNLRDFEGRSALLLGKAKDNNASCALGPFVRLFDQRFTLDDVRNATLGFRIEGLDGFRLDGSASISGMSRDPTELVAQAYDEHQYPDGFVIFLGTPFAPVADRDVPGRGFTHKPGDVVSVSTSRLGTLRNRVTTCAAAPPWNLGIGALMSNLAGRGLLTAP